MADRGDMDTGRLAGLTLIQSTHFSLRGMEKSGFLGRYVRTLEWYKAEFARVTVYSSDTDDYSAVLGVPHCHPSWSPPGYGIRHMAYYLWLVAKARGMHGIIRVMGSNIPTLAVVRVLASSRMAVTYQYDYAGLAAREHGRKSAIALVSHLMEAAAVLPADLVEATTPSLAHKVRTAYGRPTVLVPNWVDVNACGIAATSQRDPDLIVYAGRLHRSKGIHVLLDALATVVKMRPAVRLVICGQGDEESRLKGLAARLKLDNVSFVGRVENSDCLDLFGRAAAFVLPTTASEGHPKALIEAMACGTPCIVTDVPGSNELVSDMDNGRVVPPRDPTALAAALLDVLGAPELGASLGTRAAESVAGLDIASVMKREIAALSSLRRRNA